MKKQTKFIAESEWRWYGHASHFICGTWCRFHLATEIGDVLVSTVGEYIHPRHSQGSESAEADWLKKNWPGEDIGCNRKYETMVFKKVNGRCRSKECGCGRPDVDWSELDFAGYHDAGAATRGHMKLCAKWAKKKGQKP